MPILDKNTFEFLSRSPEQSRRLGMRLGSLLQPGDLICLQGELGAGKTTFVQGMAQGWGAMDAVSSPTFVLVNVYRRPDYGQFFHFDAYRVDSIGEAEELDLDDLLSQGPLVIEWPERVNAILPEERMWAWLEYVADEQRSIRILSRGDRYEGLLKTYKHDVSGSD
jgi:tRNA threonylcarbamoyladenosine biosynthesis protein TsaE